LAKERCEDSQLLIGQAMPARNSEQHKLAGIMFTVPVGRRALAQRHEARAGLVARFITTTTFVAYL